MVIRNSIILIFCFVGFCSSTVLIAADRVASALDLTLSESVVCRGFVGDCGSSLNKWAATRHIYMNSGYYDDEAKKTAYASLKESLGIPDAQFSNWVMRSKLSGTKERKVFEVAYREASALLLRGVLSYWVDNGALPNPY